ncbi:hypothetical protein D8B26_005418 [Coccidioides posadasii str. Silveira]|uniref:uncharacterized protein n=1 Tax=Coccidioides posadasii (strain RMSCC 757 / Silveira) TaxID=443226 RepID=UPI001BEDEE9E|nr:hypothetical protein D8B26_005418 [Coccidioides posadasii str. Silveira]
MRPSSAPASIPSRDQSKSKSDWTDWTDEYAVTDGSDSEKDTRSSRKNDHLPFQGSRAKTMSILSMKLKNAKCPEEAQPLQARDIRRNMLGTEMK